MQKQQLDLYGMIMNFMPMLTQFKAGEPEGGTNMVIGGSYALEAHGLNLGRDPEDLDLVIYRPTERQLALLRMLSPLQQPRKYKFQDEEEQFQYQRSWKFKRNKQTLNILLNRNVDMPYDLLLYKTESGMFYVQSIRRVIEAKNAYQINSAGHEKYIRLKDMKDLQNLKQLNFNLPVETINSCNDANAHPVVEEDYHE